MQVPKDAWELDLVFSDSGLGGSGHFYDNNGGFDYHVPVRGSLHPQPRLSIVHVAVEMAPIAKVHSLQPHRVWSLLQTEPASGCLAPPAPLQRCPCGCQDGAHFRGLNLLHFKLTYVPPPRDISPLTHAYVTWDYRKPRWQQLWGLSGPLSTWH